MRALFISLSLATPLFIAMPSGCGAASTQVAHPAESASAASSESTVAPSSTPSSAATSAACVPSARSQEPFTHVEVGRDAMIVCVGGAGAAPVPCLSVDPRNARIEAAPSWAPPAGTPTDAAAAPPSPAKRQAAFTVSSTATEISVCKAGTTECRTVKPGSAALPGVGWGEDYKAAATEKLASTTFTRKFHAAANDDGSKLFVLVPELAKKGSAAALSSWKVYGDTFDVATGKRLSHAALMGDGGTSSAVADLGAAWQLTWLGERVWLAGFDAHGPTAAQEFLDPAAGTTLSLGDPSFLVQAGDVWLLGTASPSGDVVKIVEPKSLSNLAKYALPGHAAASPARYVLQATPRNDGTVWVAFANPPGAIVIDAAKHAASAPALLPICP